MSKIKAELVDASGLKPARGEDDATFMARVVIAVSNDVSEDVWSKISDSAQDWNNEAADALKLGKPLPVFSDAVVEVVPAPAGRRRAAAAPAAPAPYELTKGDEVVATSKRGKVVTGFVIDIVDGVAVLNPAYDGPEADDVELPIANNTFEPVQSEEPVAAGKTPAEELAGLAEPEVGDTIEVTTKRGKIIVGNITVLEGDDLVLVDAAGSDHELSLAALASVKVKVKNSKSAAAPAPAPAPAASGRRRGAAADTVAADDVSKPARSSNPPGISLGGRIRELMCDDESLSVEDVCKKLTAEKINFRDTSVKMIRKDVLDVIAILRKLKKIK